MFQHIVYSLANRQGLFAYVRTCKTRLDTTTKLMVVVTSLFNLACYFIHFIIILWQLVWTWLLIYHDGSSNVVQVCSFIKPWTVCSNMHEQACQQHCSIWPAQPCSSRPAQKCSSWPAPPCPSLSTGKNKLCVFTCVPNVNYLCLSIRLMIYFCWIKFEAECKTLKENLQTLKHDHEMLTAENNKLRAQVDGLLALKKGSV